METLLRVGVITSTHGVRGEVKVFPTTDDPARFKTLREVILDTGKEQLNLEIQNVKFFKNMVILKFKGYDSIDSIEKYRTRELFVPRDQALELEENEYYIGDLIGLQVISDTGEELGVLRDVMEGKANDVYVVERPGHKELLIPAIGDCILKVDLEAAVMEVHLLDGLLDL